MDPKTEDNVIPLSVLVAAIWQRRLVVLVATLLGILIAAGLYLWVPRTFAGTVDVRPLRPSAFSAYSSLAEAGFFPKTAGALRDRFVFDLRDPSALATIIGSVAAAKSVNAKSPEYQKAIADFIRDISLERVDLGGGEAAVRIRFRFGDRYVLADMIRAIFSGTSKQLSQQLVMEIRNRINTMLDVQAGVALDLTTKIAAARKEADAQRLDKVARLREDSSVAKLLGIEKPIVVRPLPTADGSKGTPIVNVGVPENYLQGYEALDQQIHLLESRSDNSPYVDNLRSLERQLYIVKNDPKPEWIESLLAKSPLAHPDQAELVRSDVSVLRIEQAFPRLSAFLGGGFLIGFLLGIVFAAIRGLGLMRQRVDSDVFCPDALRG
jgi:LPS O-antigen subunit length determinant protein (WzzB/FepE family)